VGRSWPCEWEAMPILIKPAWMELRPRAAMQCTWAREAGARRRNSGPKEQGGEAADSLSMCAAPRGGSLQCSAVQCSPSAESLTCPRRGLSGGLMPLRVGGNGDVVIGRGGG